MSLIQSASEDTQAGLARYYGAMPGVVIDSADPEGKHRVRVTIPGLIELSAWADPITAGGGSGKRGAHAVPANGSTVIVWFLGGDPERPIYAGGWWGDDESPEESTLATTDAHKVQSIEFNDVRITVDERDNKRAIAIENKITGDQIVLDLLTGAAKVDLTTGLLIRAIGAINLEATTITLNGRVVLASSAPIR
jgi:hypothetical protein